MCLKILIKSEFGVVKWTSSLIAVLCLIISCIRKNIKRRRFMFLELFYGHSNAIYNFKLIGLLNKVFS